MNNHDQTGGGSWTSETIRVCLLIGILLLALGLRLWDLDAKSLWQDEIFTTAIASAENTPSQVASIALYNTPLPAPPLYFVVTHCFLHVGDSDFVLRFPALLFGVLGVATIYTLGARLFGKSEGLVSAFLLSISPLHVRYSQDARFYSLLTFLSLLSLYFLYRGVFENKRRWWTGFVLCSILNVYTHLFAFFVLLAQTVFVAGLWLAGALMSVRRWRSPEEGSDLRRREVGVDRRMGLAFVLSLAVVGLAYTPMVPHVLRGLGGAKGLGATAGGSVSFTPSFVLQQLDAWGLGSGEAILVLLIPFLVGIIASARAQRTQLWVGVCWFVVPFAALSLLPVHHRFRPRYALFILPLYLLFVARGLTATGGMIGVLRPREASRLRGVTVAVLLLAIALLSVPALQAYYVEDRADWRAVATLLGSSMRPGDAVVSPGGFAQVVLPRYHKNLREVEFVIGGSEVFLTPDRDARQGLWFVGLQEERMSAIERELEEVVSHHFKVVIEVNDQSVARGRLLKIAPVMYKDIWVLYAREDLGPQEVLELYEGALEIVPFSTAFPAHMALEELYREEHDFDHAVIHYQEASTLDPDAPEPHYGLALVFEAQGLQQQYVGEWRIYEELAGQ